MGKVHFTDLSLRGKKEGLRPRTHLEGKKNMINAKLVSLSNLQQCTCNSFNCLCRKQQNTIQGLITYGAD
jgi:hypothetical protein